MRGLLVLLCVLLMVACSEAPVPEATTANLSPDSTATARPVSTPTAVPRNVVTPTPRSNWRGRSSSDPLTNAASEALSNTGVMLDGDEFAVLYDDPLLVLRCIDQDFDVYVNWGGRFIAGIDYIPMQYKVDEGRVWRTRGEESTSNEASFFRGYSGSAFTKRILGGSVVIIRATDFDGERMTASFDVTGLDGVLDKLPCFEREE